MRTLLEIYFGINLFIIGLGINPEDKKRSLAWFNVIIFLLFGLFIITGVYIYDHWLIPLVEVLQIKFFFQLYFTKKWNDSSLLVLQNINEWRNRLYITKSIKDRMYRYVTGLLFKRNNFDPETDEIMSKLSFKRVYVISFLGFSIESRGFNKPKFPRLFTKRKNLECAYKNISCTELDMSTLKCISCKDCEHYGNGVMLSRGIYFPNFNKRILWILIIIFVVIIIISSLESILEMIF